MMTSSGFWSRPASAGPSSIGLRIFCLLVPCVRRGGVSVLPIRRKGEGREGLGGGGGTHERAPPSGVWYLYSIPCRSAIASCSFLTVGVPREKGRGRGGSVGRMEGRGEGSDGALPLPARSELRKRTWRGACGEGKGQQGSRRRASRGKTSNVSDTHRDAVLVKQGRRRRDARQDQLRVRAKRVGWGSAPSPFAARARGRGGGGGK